MNIMEFVVIRSDGWQVVHHVAQKALQYFTGSRFQDKAVAAHPGRVHQSKRLLQIVLEQRIAADRHPLPGYGPRACGDKRLRLIVSLRDDPFAVAWWLGYENVHRRHLPDAFTPACAP